MPGPVVSYIYADSLTEGLSVRGRRNVMTAANQASAHTWQRKFKMRHYEAGAAARYGYAKRTAATIARKKRLARVGIVQDGGRLPLVHSGALRNAMRAQFVIRATPRFSTVRMVGPPYFNIRYRANRPNLGNEATAVTNEEISVIQTAAIAAADHAVTVNQRVRKRTIKARS